MNKIKSTETMIVNDVLVKQCSAKIHIGDLWLPLTQFHKSLTYVDGYANSCKACVSARGKKDRDHRIKNDPHRMQVFKNARKRERERGGKIRQLFYAAMERARKKGLTFDITREDIIIPEVCPVLGIPIKFGVGRKGDELSSGPGNCDNSPSVDRIDNLSGYTKDNIRVISWRANYLKNTATLDELILLGDDAKKLKLTNKEQYHD